MKDQFMKFLRDGFQKANGREPDSKEQRKIERDAVKALEQTEPRRQTYHAGFARAGLLALAGTVALLVVAALPLVTGPADVHAAGGAGCLIDSSLAVAADEQGFAGTGMETFHGFSMRESAASAAVATFILRHGTSASGTPIAVIELNPDESTREWWGPNGVAVPSGVYIDRVAGTADVILFYKN